MEKNLVALETTYSPDLGHLHLEHLVCSVICMFLIPLLPFIILHDYILDNLQNQRLWCFFVFFC